MNEYQKEQLEAQKNSDGHKSKLGLIYHKEKIWEPLPTEPECLYDNTYSPGLRRVKEKGRRL